ncbi:DUF4835 domain-containing protein [Nonlabens arenilitoris]|uniref:DUF4835 domain-containing protein n=1 Tax=Nonlabens arenilitoris TaxID=1217969 RepID=A0A2S7U653_9FLAO|nr:DUF4835 family protein [Nonlabens arenilitoris]PQJ30496.1 DUF4835 domain-containing protein [Nonlabens arenilitoris]
MKLLKEFFKVIPLFILLCVSAAQAQEFNAVVQVNAQNVAQPDQTIFRTLETSMQEFINNTKWTQQDYRDEEKINCSIVFVITDYDNDRFKGNMQISLSRPVYNSSYSSPIFNFKDSNIEFEYLEFAPFFYNANQYENNLTSLISFYIYTMLGIDGDTFSLNGGQQYHVEAQRIVSLAQQSNSVGWKATDGQGTRFQLNDDMLSQTFKEYREVLYGYHSKGMDTFADDQKKAKLLISAEILKLKALNSRRPNSLIQRLFFDAKADEIVSIFSGGPAVDVRDLKNALQQLAPNQSSKWRNIKV